MFFLAGPGTKGADAVLWVGGTGIFSTGAVYGRWGRRLQREEQSGLSPRRARSRSQEQLGPGQLLLTACLTREFPQAAQVTNTRSLVPHMVHRKDCVRLWTGRDLSLSSPVASQVLGRSVPLTPESLRASQMPAPHLLLVSVSGSTRLPLV